MIKMTSTNTKITVGVVAGLLLAATVTTLIVLKLIASGEPANHDTISQETKATIPAAPVDLTTSYTTPASYFDQITSFPAWQTVPRGEHVFGHVKFQIGGMICLWGSGNASAGLVFPDERLGIPVN